MSTDTQLPCRLIFDQFVDRISADSLGYAWGEMGGYVDRVLADSVNQFSAMGCPSYERSQQQPLSSVPKVAIVERFKCI